MILLRAVFYGRLLALGFSAHLGHSLQREAAATSYGTLNENPPATGLWSRRSEMRFYVVQ